MRTHSRQSGFVLLMTLVLLMMAVVALAGMAHRSIIAALDSRTAVEDLQRRWATTSIRSALLKRIGKLLDRAERGEVENGELSERYLNAPIAQLHVSCTLSGMDYELVLTDEQAKLNLNRLLKRDDRAKVRSIVRRLTDRSNSANEKPAALTLLTGTVGADDPGKRGALPRIGSYGQIFTGASPERLIGGEKTAGLAADITCWGDGKVNLRRARDQVVRYACGGDVQHDVVRELLEERNRNPYRRLSAILGRIDEIDEKQKAAVRRCLTDKSTCHGLWIIARGNQRSWHSLAVNVGKAAAEPTRSDGLGSVKWREFAW